MEARGGGGTGTRSQPRPVQRVQAGWVGEAGHRGQGGGEAAQGGGGQQRGRQRGGGSLVGRISAGLQHVVNMLSLYMRLLVIIELSMGLRS